MKREINNFENTDVFYTGNAPKSNQSNVKQKLLDFDEWVWNKGQNINFLGLGNLLPSDDWTDGKSDSKTINFFKNVGDLIIGKSQSDVENIKFSSDDEEKGFVVEDDSIEKFDINSAPINSNLKLNFTTMEYEENEFDAAPEKFQPDFLDNK